MGIIGGELGYRIFRYMAGVSSGNEVTTAYDGKSKMEVLFGPDVWKELAGKTVVDFGCEGGIESVDMAQHGVARVIGIDLYEDALELGRKRASEAGVADRCVFTTRVEEKVDVVVSLDAFEHFADPLGILSVMRGLLKENGYILACFGPTWYHPLGGHGFSIFPWSHLLFTENSQMRLYRETSSNEAQHFSEVRGGLNQLSIRRFKKIVAQSEFEFQSFEPLPIRKLRLLANPLTREFTTSMVRCRLVPRNHQQTHRP